jgi:hypothetical protein
MFRTAILVLCTLALALNAAYASASTTPGPDTFKVDYFANANTSSAPDATVHLTNPGTSGNICAAIYVFDPNQEISECCSCLLSPDGLRTLSVNTDLTGAPLTGVMLTTGSIEIVSTPPLVNGVCPALPTSLSPRPAIRAWATHIQNGNFAITETPSQDATLSSAEERRIEGECYAIQLDSGRGGQCTCGTGD